MRVRSRVHLPRNAPDKDAAVYRHAQNRLKSPVYIGSASHRPPDARKAPRI